MASEIKITPPIIDITMPMAVTNSISYVFTRKDGTPIDITTATLYFTVKEVEWDDASGDDNAKIKKELSITDGPAGKARLFLTQEETFLPAGQYFYDIKIIQTSETAETTVNVALMGTFTLVADRTNRVVGVA
jgi:hypothetical protein